MKNIVIISLIAIVSLANLQAGNRFVLTDFEYESYPSLKADFYISDSNYVPLDFTTQDFYAVDNARDLTISSLIDGTKQRNVTPHHVILFDASLSPTGGANSTITLAKQLAKSYASVLDLEDEKLSVIAFSQVADLVVSKSDDSLSIAAAIDAIDGADFATIDAALKFKSTGLIEYLQRFDGEAASVLIITDNFSEFDIASIDQLESMDVEINLASMVRRASAPLVELTERTGGHYIDMIQDIERVEDAITVSIMNSRSYEPYSVELKDVLNCDTDHLFAITLYDSLEVSTEFEILDALRPLLQSDPPYLSFSSVLPGTSLDLPVSVRALNSEIFIDSIRIENDYNGAFEIISGGVDQQQIALGENQSHQMTIRYTPVDSAIVFTKLLIYSNACDGNEILMTGGFPNTPPNEETITLLSPRCDQTLIVGDTFKIEWTGVLPKDVIQLEYSTNNGTNWDTLATNVVDLEYDWLVPNTISDDCLIRAIQLWPNNIGRTLDLPHTTPVKISVFSKDGSEVLSASDDNILRLWNSNTGSVIREYTHQNLGHDRSITDVAFSSDESKVISASLDGKIIIWNKQTGEIDKRLLGHNNPVLDFEIFKDSLLLSISRGSAGNPVSKLIVWDLETGDLIKEHNDISDSKWFIEDIELHPIKNELVISYLERGVFSYDMDVIGDRLEEIKEYDVKVLGQNKTYHSFTTISPDGRYIFVSENLSRSKPGIVLDYETGDYIYHVVHPAPSPNSGTPINSAEFFFDDVNSWLITSGEDQHAIQWDAETGDSLATFMEHEGNVFHAEFNFDGSRVVTSSGDYTAKVWNLKERDLQMDTTDCNFAISTAIIQSNDLSVGSSIIRETVDTVFTNFLFNGSDFEFEIFDIRLMGANADEFEIIEGWAPYPIEGKSSSSISISFTPKAVGVRNAELLVTFPGNSVTIPINGIGLDPGIKQLTDVVDFGEVELGDYLTLEDIELIENSSGEDVRIDSIVITGIERDFFSYANMSAPSILTQTEKLTGNLRFTPLEEAPFAATLKIYHDAPASPTNILLTGIGVPPKLETMSLALASAIGDPGEIVNIPLRIEEYSFLPGEAPIGTIAFELEFDPTILEPLFPNKEDILEFDKRTVSVEFPLESADWENGIFGNLDFKLALGMDSVSRLSIRNLRYEGAGKMILFAKNGEVKIASLCYEGGLRLFDGRGQIAIQDISPNPVVNSTNVSIELAEAAPTKIYVVDNSGKVVANLRNEYMDAGIHEVDLDISFLSPGSYYLIVKTEVDMIQTRFLISK